MFIKLSYSYDDRKLFREPASTYKLAASGFCEERKSAFKQTDAAAAILQISFQKDSRPSEFSRPLTTITLNLNGICLLTAAASVCLSSLSEKMSADSI